MKTHILLFTDNVDQEHETMIGYKEAARDYKGNVGNLCNPSTGQNAFLKLERKVLLKTNE